MLLSFTSLCFGKGQSLSPAVVSSAGDYAANENLQISWTVGEPVVETFHSGDLFLTQGFQQPVIITGPDVINEDELLREIKTYPNPVTNRLILAVKFDNSINLTFEIFDLTGKKLWIRQQRDMPAAYDFTIDMTGFQKGMYLLKVRSDDRKFNTIIKILKQ